MSRHVSLFLRTRRRCFLAWMVCVFCLLAFLGALIGAWPVFYGATISAVGCLWGSENNGGYLW